jgi:preprotein translocase subunit YajC
MATQRRVAKPPGGERGETAVARDGIGKDVTVQTYAIVAAEPKKAPAGGDQDQEPTACWMQMLPLIGIFIIFYFLLIRPQQKKQKEAERQKQEMLANLARNDHVMTIGGIHGVVTNVGDDEVTIRVDDKTDARLRVSRDAISRVVGEEDEDQEQESK